MPAGKSSPDANTTSRDARRLSTLLEGSQALSGTLNLKAAMHRVLGILVRHHGLVRGMITLLREQELHVEAAEGFEDRARSVSYKVGEGITGKVVQSGKPVIVFNVCGNTYRLIVAMHFNSQMAYTLRFLTHAEYDRDDWKDEL